MNEATEEELEQVRQKCITDGKLQLTEEEKAEPLDKIFMKFYIKKMKKVRKDKKGRLTQMIEYFDYAFDGTRLKIHTK